MRDGTDNIKNQGQAAGKEVLPTENPARADARDTGERAGTPHRHQPEFDIDVEDLHSYRERQEAYIEDVGLDDDPGTFEN